ncbi:MAG: CRISPR-associated endonuclease Cas2 [Methylococcaceae bacterium]|nr:CRISPR-associated endonuclease Cas2 [Methylococcaceae bacterium]
MKEAGEFVVAYDVSNDIERRKVDKVLLGFGFRVQKSVFECKLTRADQRAVIAALEALDLHTGSVRIYRVYGGTQVRTVGKPINDPDSDFAYVV